MRAVAAFCVVNAALLVGAVIWMAGTFFGGVTGPRMVEVPATYAARTSPSESGMDGVVPNEDDDVKSPEISDEEDIHPNQRLASDAYAGGHFDEAVELIRHAIDDMPESAALWNDLGTYCLAGDEEDEAARAFERATEVAPNDARSHFNLGTLRLRSGKPEEAVPSLQRAVALNPYYTAAHCNLGCALGRIGRREEAMREYITVTQIDRSPAAAKSYFNLGVLHMKERQWHDAIVCFTDALQLQPDYVPARYNKALVLSRLQLSDDAEDEYHKLLQIEPGQIESRINLGVLYMRREDWGAAAAEFERAAELDSTNALAQYDLGLCYMNQNEDTLAAAAFGRARQIDPDFPEANYNLALTLKRLGRNTDAIRAYQKATTLAPDRPEYLYNLGLALTDAGEYEQACVRYRQALELAPGYYKARYNLGVVRLQTDDYRGAVTEFESALALQPTSYEATYNLGLSYLKLSEYAKAEHHLEDAVAMEATVPALYNLGLARQRQRKWAKAAESFSKSLTIDPRHAHSLEHLAECFAALGEHDRALKLFVRLQRLDPEDPSAYNFGLSLYRGGRYADARRYFDVVRDGRASLRVKSLYMIGLCSSKMSDDDGAVAAYEAALAIDRDHVPSLINLAYKMKETNRYREANELFGRALRLRPDRDDIRQELVPIAASTAH